MVYVLYRSDLWSLYTNEERMFAMKTQFHFMLVTRHFSFLLNIGTAETAPAYLLILKLILETVFLAFALSLNTLLI